MLSLILLKRIVSLYLILLAGVLLVKQGVIKTSDSKFLSTISLYLFSPCMIASSLKVEKTQGLLNGLVLSFFAAALMFAISLLIVRLTEKSLHLTAADKACFIYQNGGLMVVLIAGILGTEYIAYSLGFIAVQNIFMWTHLKSMLSGDRKPELKKIILNPNIIAITVSMLFLALNIRFPDIVETSIEMLGNMLGPVSMIVLGMIIGGMDLRKVFAAKRVWLVTSFRLIVIPVVSLLAIRLLKLDTLNESGNEIALITLLGASAPTASNITQMSIVYGGDSEYVSAVNVVSTLCCVVTMPLMVVLLQSAV